MVPQKVPNLYFQIQFSMFKGQLILKADWRAIDSPKNEQMNLFCLLFYSFRQTKQICLFVFCKNLWHTNLLFGFILPLRSTEFFH